MKTIHKISGVLTAICFMLIGCTSIDDSVVTTSNMGFDQSGINLQYETFVSYPISEKIEGPAPTFDDIPVVYGFSIGMTSAPAGADIATLMSKVSIDNLTGVVTVDNSTDTFAVGTYKFTVSISTVEDMCDFTDVLTLEILDVPVTPAIAYTYGQEIGYTYAGEVATISYTDDSPDKLIDDDEVSFVLYNAPTGLTINTTTGVINKSTNLTFGEHNISVEVKTNLGARVFHNVGKLTVEEAPILTYNINGSETELTELVGTPFSEYTSSTPSLSGMTASKYELILPDGLPAAAITIDPATGVFSLPADHPYIPDGEYEIGFSLTDATSATVVAFPAEITLSIAADWDSAPISQDFTAANSNFSVHSNLTLSESDAANWFFDTAAPTGYKINQAGANAGKIFDEYLVAAIDVAGKSGPIKVTFGIMANNQPTLMPNFYCGDSRADIDSSSFDAANWTLLESSENMPKVFAGSLITKEVNLSEMNIVDDTIYFVWAISDPANASVKGFAKVTSFEYIGLDYDTSIEEK